MFLMVLFKTMRTRSKAHTKNQDAIQTPESLSRSQESDLDFGPSPPVAEISSVISQDSNHQVSIQPEDFIESDEDLELGKNAPSSKKPAKKSKKIKNAVSHFTMSPPTSTDTNSKMESEMDYKINEAHKTTEDENFDLLLEKAMQDQQKSETKNFKKENSGSKATQNLDNSPKIRIRQKNSHKIGKNTNRHGVVLLHSQEKMYKQIMKSSHLYKNAQEFHRFKEMFPVFIAIKKLSFFINFLT